VVVRFLCPKFEEKINRKERKEINIVDERNDLRQQ
jgi:hypothetical protein